MSDFTSNFWSIYVAAITLAGIFGCLALLWISGTTKAVTDTDNTTGHVWDGDLREMNNPLPRWWVGLFIITCVFSLIYLYLYPGLGSYPGSLRWTQTEQLDRELERGRLQTAPIYAGFAHKDVPELARDPQAMAIGERLFLNNCSQCHGSDARGGTGFPNLTDGDWLWGGTPERIDQTITDGRTGIMPPMAAAVGTADDVRNLANYVVSLSGGPHDSVRAALGKPKFVVCAACHGADGKGNEALGAPNLTDNVWLHGPGVEAHVTNMINNGKTSVMPAWGDKFSPEQIKVLTAYVWGRGGGVVPAAAAASAPAAAVAAAPAASGATAAPGALPAPAGAGTVPATEAALPGSAAGPSAAAAAPGNAASLAAAN